MIKWKTLKGYSRYKISQDGEILSFVQYEFGKILKHSYTKDGYPQIKLRDDFGGKKTFRVHRLVAILFIKNPKNLPEVNHIDGNKLNSSFDNLEWCNPRHNQLHAYSTGLRKRPFGTLNHFSKLTEEQVSQIKNWIRNGISYHEVIRYFCIKKSTYYNIKNGVSWSHIN